MKIRLKSYYIKNIFFIICFLLNSGYCYVLKSDTYTLLSLFVCGCIVIGYYGILRKKFLTKKFWLHPFTWLAIWIFIEMFLKFELRIYGTYFRQILVLIIAVFIAQNISFKRFIKTFISFMFIVSCISIIAWILVNILSIDLHLPIMNSNWEKALFTEYQNGILFFIHSHQPYKLMGPFWEPGLYASMTILAYLFLNEEYYNKRQKKIIGMTFIVGIILSFSTAGYLLLLVVFIIKILSNSEQRVSIFLFLSICLSLFFVIMFSNDILNYLATVMPGVFGKMINGSISASTRVNGPLVDLIIFMDNPIIGAGYLKYLNEWPYYANLLNVESRTSTITYFMAVFGLPGLLYLVTIFKGVMSQVKIGNYIKIFVLFIFVSIVTKEPHYVNLFMVTLFAYFSQDKYILNNKSIKTNI